MKRDTYFDFLRGLAIVAVIGIHTIIIPKSYDSFVDIFTVAIRQSLAFAVPLFLAISGYFLYQKKVETREDYYIFLRKQIPAVYMPMLFWSVPWLLLGLISGKSLFNLIPLMLVGGLSIFYFIALIIECYIFLPLFKKISLTGLFLLIVTSLLWHALMAYLRWWKMYDLPMVVYCSIPGYAIYYGIGCFLAKQKETIKISLLFVLLIVFLAEQVLETIWLNNILGIDAIGIKILTPLFSITAILFLFNSSLKTSFKQNKITKLFVTLGEHSFTIYLTHLCLWFIISRIVTIDIWAIRWLLLIVADTIFVLIIKKATPYKFHIYLGIR